MLFILTVYQIAIRYNVISFTNIFKDLMKLNQRVVLFSQFVDIYDYANTKNKDKYIPSGKINNIFKHTYIFKYVIIHVYPMSIYFLKCVIYYRK